jgi:hypothetical protein
MTIGVNLSAGNPLKGPGGSQFTTPNVSTQSKPIVAAGRLLLQLPKTPGRIKVDSSLTPIFAWPRSRPEMKVGTKGHNAYLEKSKPTQHTHQTKGKNKKWNQLRLAAGSAVACLIQSRDGLIQLASAAPVSGVVWFERQTDDHLKLSTKKDNTRGRHPRGAAAVQSVDFRRNACLEEGRLPVPNRPCLGSRAFTGAGFGLRQLDNRQRPARRRISSQTSGILLGSPEAFSVEPHCA